MGWLIDKMMAKDWEQVSKIYGEGIKTDIATFERQVPTWEQWDSSHLKECRLILRKGSKIAGWCALTPTSSRCVYKGVAEVSVYVAEEYKGLGVGTSLLKEIIYESEELGIWTLQSSIIADNEASLGLHESCGFRVVGYRERIAQNSKGQWKDVIVMERRSLKVGVE